MITGMHHAEITVSDIDRSIAFYRDVLGLDLVGKSGEATPDPAAIGLPGEETRVIVAFVRAGNDIIELIQYVTPVGRPYDRRNCDPGSGHIALTVADIEEACRTLASKGVKFNQKPSYVDYGYMKGCYWVYTRDPDGATIELVQLPRD